jgi:hypothetical protein
MGWRRHTDFHGSREYGSDQPNHFTIGSARLTFAWILYTARNQLERLLRPALPTSPARLPEKAYQKGVTVLGSSNDRLPRRRAVSTACAFPERPDRRDRHTTPTRVQ